MVTREIKHRNDFKIISMFYFTREIFDVLFHMQPRLKLLFKNYFSDTEHVGNIVESQ